MPGGGLIMVAAAGLAGGAMNALAGGGSFVTLPAMIAAGVPSTIANASSTVALWPGGLASSWAYRDRLEPLAGIGIRPLLIVTVAGGLAGSLLLLWTPSATFDLVVPWLLLVATLAMAFARPAGAWLRRVVVLGPRTVIAVQALLGVYGGYFGGGVGLMMLAIWGLLEAPGERSLNPLRTLLTSAANSTAVIVFALAREVASPQTLAMLGGALIGGHGGALIGRRLSARVIRVGTLVLTVAMTIAFFIRAYAD